jgi:tetratricopeptide (TPR) repeat protein
MKWVLAAVIAFAACDFRSQSVALPEINSEGFSRPVRIALETAHRNARANPSDAALCGHLGMVLHAHEQFAPAAQVYSRAQALDSGNPVWPYYLSEALAQIGDSPAALAALRRSLEIDGGYAPGRLRMAGLLLSSGNPAEAERSYRGINSSDAHYGLGRSLAALGRVEEAIDALNRVCDLHPSFGAAHLALGMQLRKSGQEERAQQHLRLAQLYRDQSPPVDDPRMAAVRALDVSASGLIRLGSRLDRDGRIQDAIAAHCRAIEAEPRSEQAHTNLISLFARAGNFAKAEEHYRAALEINPAFADAHYNYGVLQFQRRQFDEAATSFRRAVASNPQHANAHLNLGFVLERNGRPVAALALYEKAAELLPSLRLAHFHAGRMLTNKRRYREAIAHFYQALQPEDEDTPGYIYALGIAYGRAGDRATARHWLSKALGMAQGRLQTDLASSLQHDLERLGAVR